jgi:hypothetical protein
MRCLHRISRLLAVLKAPTRRLEGCFLGPIDTVEQAEGLNLEPRFIGRQSAASYLTNVLLTIFAAARLGALGLPLGEAEKLIP